MTDEPDAYRRLARAIRKAGSLRKFAATLDVSHSYISQVMHGKLPPSVKLLKAVGLTRHVTFKEQR